MAHTSWYACIVRWSCMIPHHSITYMFFHHNRCLRFLGNFSFFLALLSIFWWNLSLALGVDMMPSNTWCLDLTFHNYSSRTLFIFYRKDTTIPFQPQYSIHPCKEARNISCKWLLKRSFHKLLNTFLAVAWWLLRCSSWFHSPLDNCWTQKMLSKNCIYWSGQNKIFRKQYFFHK